MELLCCGRTHSTTQTIRWPRSANVQKTHNTTVLSCCVVGFLHVGTSGSPYSLRCVVGTSTTQQFHFVVLPKNPQHNNLNCFVVKITTNNLKLLCCGFSGRWHMWATVYIDNTTQRAETIGVLHADCGACSSLHHCLVFFILWHKIAWNVLSYLHCSNVICNEHIDMHDLSRLLSNSAFLIFAVYLKPPKTFF